MKICDLLQEINNFASFDLCAEWDNSGLIIGDYDSEVKKIAVTLDAVPEAVIKASELNCNLLITHHPLIFRGLKRINYNNWLGLAIKEAIKREINIIALHTNFDRAESGVNSILAKKINLEDCENLSDYGIKGNLREKMSLKNFLEFVKNSWNLTQIDYYFENERDIKRVALCGGSGSEFWEFAKDCDIYITCDMKYHELIDAVRSGLVMALCNHGEMERASLQELSKKFNAVLLDIKALNNHGRI